MNETPELLSRAREYLLAADLGPAETVLRQVIAQDPAEGRAYELLGKLLYRESRGEEAAAVYRAWLHAVPGDPVAVHLVSATGGDGQPPRASNEFIESIFGRAAADFDATLAALKYRVPELIFARAMAVLDPTSVALNILDLGCGTGLCGEWFRPLANRIVGVDLAPQMLEVARARDCYDELFREEITAYIALGVEHFDIIVAADVFCYFADLDAIFAAVSALLRPGGLFVFSVEESSWEVGDRPCLQQHGRYAHSESYLQQIMARVSLADAGIVREVLRFERGAPVVGLVAAARR